MRLKELIKSLTVSYELFVKVVLEINPSFGFEFTPVHIKITDLIPASQCVNR